MFPFLSLSARHQAKGLKRARDADGEGGSKPKIAKPPPTLVDGSFKGYDLSVVPQEAWPQSGENKGAHGYTVKAENGSAIWLSLDGVINCVCCFVFQIH